MSDAREKSVSAKFPSYVLDSFALLAYLQGEPGNTRVKDLLAEAEAGECIIYLSLINLGEILYIIERERSLTLAQRTLAAIDQLPLQIAPVSRATVLAAAHLKARYPISYADAFAVVAAQDHDGVLITGDPEFRSLARDKVVAVDWLPRN